MTPPGPYTQGARSPIQWSIVIVPDWVSEIADEQAEEVEKGCPVSVAIERAVMAALSRVTRGVSDTQDVTDVIDRLDRRLGEWRDVAHLAAAALGVDPDPSPGVTADRIRRAREVTR